MEKTFWKVAKYENSIREVTEKQKMETEKRHFLGINIFTFFNTLEEAVTEVRTRSLRDIERIEKQLKQAQSRLKAFEKKWAGK